MKIIFPLILLLTGFVSCHKMLEVDPPGNQTTTDRVFASSQTATASILGIYSEMMNANNQFSAGQMTLLSGLYADELKYYFPVSYQQGFADNQLEEINHAILEGFFWSASYKYIYAANLAIDKLRESAMLTDSVKAQLSGEALFIRAFCYFQLVNLFGDVPLALTSDYRVTEQLPRVAVSEVYQQMIEDLTTAADNLPMSYAGGLRVRPTKLAAKALMARVFLYQHNWTEAERAATEAIESGQYELASQPSEVFLKDSPEAIWQLLPVDPRFNTLEAGLIQAPGPNSPVNYMIDSSLINAFEEEDKRKSWIGEHIYLAETYPFPFKYKNGLPDLPINEYYMVLRLAELYLVRAEARAYQQKLGEAASDITTIRNRAGLSAFDESNSETTLSAILQERRIELAFEWGHRFLDLKRFGKINEALEPLKQKWNLSDTLWPIPIKQIQANPKLYQNAGY